MLYLMARQYVLNIKAADSYATRLEVRVGEREAELEKSYELLREVERRETVAVERQRLMRDMHDGMGSSLMGALVAVERGHLYQVEIAQMLRECIDDLKLTIDSLEAVESDLPLVLATLRYRLGPRFERAGIELIWNVGEVTAAGALDSERALHVLRMVQEMFSNIVKHASATRVTVTTIVEGQDVLLVVEDNGIGFSSVEAQGSPGRGMKNLVHRAAALGAGFTWFSRPGETRFELRLPLNQDVRS
jgi:signal transduction histidine kinase